ncbi:hypothetical protein K503DRAFT_799046 [Rhizopogon vinicolor AM-OR11-026]|uniref:Uncharacterized protein n=1 Tax=Rhizopogon vinicolor AM-OR11-026 TaxID=1314800 RepID=A0A1B7N5M2_9AGAM|nr:hypothetical protein K503DRAFT_799046 [Rhizopogon vinicolor AM-OR11-026]
MAVPSIEGLQQAATELLREADAEGQLRHVLTVRIVREKLEKRLELSPGTLDAKEYKAPIKQTVVDYLAKDSADVLEVDEEESQPKPKKRKVKVDEELVKTRNSVSKPKTSSKGTKGKQATRSSAVVKSEASESSDDEAPTRKQRAKPSRKKVSLELQSEDDEDDKHEAKPLAPKRSQKASKAKNLASGSAAKPYKSAATIESSGDETDSKRPSKLVVTVSKKEVQSPKKSPLKEKPLSKPKSTAKQQTEQMDEKSGVSPSTSVKNPPSKSKARARSEPESDSSLSTVIDEPPKKRQKKQDKDLSKKGPTEQKKARKSNTGGLSKDDEAVSKLKAMVVACGIRKVWKKEFADLDTPSEQIKRLKEILKDLGMSGRLSLEKAKSIRAKRELAQELKDVQEFAETSRRREMRKENGVSENEDLGSESDDEDDSPPIKKKRTAGASILAFLQDQSDEE